MRHQSLGGASGTDSLPCALWVFALAFFFMFLVEPSSKFTETSGTFPEQLSFLLFFFLLNVQINTKIAELSLSCFLFFSFFLQGFTTTQSFLVVEYTETGPLALVIIYSVFIFSR